MQYKIRVAQGRDHHGEIIKGVKNRRLGLGFGECVNWEVLEAQEEWQDPTCGTLREDWSYLCVF